MQTIKSEKNSSKNRNPVNTKPLNCWSARTKYEAREVLAVWRESSLGQKMRLTQASSCSGETEPVVIWRFHCRRKSEEKIFLRNKQATIYSRAEGLKCPPSRSSWWQRKQSLDGIKQRAEIENLIPFSDLLENFWGSHHLVVPLAKVQF